MKFVVAMAASCGPSGTEAADSSTETSESAPPGSTAEGMTSTSGGNTGGDTGETGTRGPETTTSSDEGTSLISSTSGDHLQDSTQSGDLDSGTAATATGSLAESSSTSEPAQTCHGLAACNDHGTCIESIGGLRCDCDVAGLAACELPLVREIGSSGTNRELILTNISADGTVIVGSHAPPGAPPDQPAVAVKWTLTGGLEMLELDPAGDNVAMDITVDHRVVVGYVKVSPYVDEWVDVVWRDGVLEPRDPSEAFDFGGPRPTTPTAAEVEDMLEELGIQHWRIDYVNAISADGKVMFWLGEGPDRWKRWQLRLP